MLAGIKTHFKPAPELANTLSQWIGCARVIYNAKCDEDAYYRKFAARFLPVGTYPEVNKEYSRYKDKELTPWLYDCPPQILRNSATIWAQAYQRFFKGLGGRPKRKKKKSGSYIWLTNELFNVRWEGTTCVLTIKVRDKVIGVERIKWNKKRVPKIPPKSIWIRKTAHRWFISFSYDDGHLDDSSPNKDHLKYLQQFDTSELEEMITPVDRGIAKPLHTHNAIYTLTQKEKDRLAEYERKRKRYYRKMARQQLGSNRRKKTVQKLAKSFNKTANIRTNFWHQTTRALVDNSQVVVIEDLKLKNMTKRPKPKQCPKTGKWLKNGAAGKSGLNRSMLNVALGQFEVLLTYKMAKANKPLFKVSPHFTSQECAHCGYTHSDNRENQSDFCCKSCGHKDNADHNAALVIRKRAITKILDSGTELAGANKNVLQSRASANSRKTASARAGVALDCLSKKKIAA